MQIHAGLNIAADLTFCFLLHYFLRDQSECGLKCLYKMSFFFFSHVHNGSLLGLTTKSQKKEKVINTTATKFQIDQLCNS